MTNEQWFKSLDRTARKHVLSILNEGRMEMIDKYLGNNAAIGAFENYISKYEDLHEQVKKERGSDQ